MLGVNVVSDEIKIDHVSDTALWVAYYRAKETERADALFRDPLAKVLIGERGKKIAAGMRSIGRYTEWSVISRTVMIDSFIQKLVGEGVDTVLNLGAGLDTRPYRMNFPNNLKWIEVDYSHIIALKNKLLNLEKPKCQLTRVELDLGDFKKRSEFLSEISSQSKKTLVLTEGVIPYLDEGQVTLLAKDLYGQQNIKYWITEFFDPRIYRYLKTRAITKRMEKAPFQFYPKDWTGFFLKCGWVPQEIQYSDEVAIKYSRKVPMPWWVPFFKIFAGKTTLEKSKKMTGYMLFRKI